MENITTKIGLAVFAFALILGVSSSDAYAFNGDRESRPDRIDRQEEHQKGERGDQKGPHQNGSDESQEFHAEQREAFELFIGLDEGELKELHEAGEKMSETLDDQNIDKDDMEDFLEEQIEDLINFISDERDLDDEQVENLEERFSNRIEHKLERWYN